MTHGISLNIIETALYRETGLPARGRAPEPDSKLQEYVGSQLSNRIMETGQSHRIHKLTTYFAYGGVAIAIVGYTIYIVVISMTHVPCWETAVTIAVYVSFAAAVVGTWRVGLRLVKEGTDVMEEWIEREEKKSTTSG